MSTESAGSAAATPDDLVVMRALGGDRKAEHEVCRRLLPAIRAFAHRRLRSATAEDFAQDALMLLIEALREGRIQEPAKVASFALGICRNLARERARSGERRNNLFSQFGLSEADFIDFDTSHAVAPAHLEDCYSQLTERARRVIRATFCDDDSDSEIADALVISESNVRVIRHRTLAALRTCLERPISWVQG